MVQDLSRVRPGRGWTAMLRKGWPAQVLNSARGRRGGLYKVKDWDNIPAMAEPPPLAEADQDLALALIPRRNLERLLISKLHILPHSTLNIYYNLSLIKGNIPETIPKSRKRKSLKQGNMLIKIRG
ncbi:hypothetical protein Acr_24g0007340 [Actinidia rufa]|uniref:Uncharacterized protein n=1 Tax=Actinidia rufa TaxID=165716 RepID=A0A7J0GVK6_9ERIC|nr:hypothetical protein Acr_24g0007340 [Actinidia rufa]